MAGNTNDKTTLKGMIQRIESLYGKAERIWVMDRGIPTEAVLAQMRQSDPPIHYLVGTPKGRLSQYEKALLEKPWQVVREGVQVKLLPQEGGTFIRAGGFAATNIARWNGSNWSALGSGLNNPVLRWPCRAVNFMSAARSLRQEDSRFRTLPNGRRVPGQHSGRD